MSFSAILARSMNRPPTVSRRVRQRFLLVVSLACLAGLAVGCNELNSRRKLQEANKLFKKGDFGFCPDKTTGCLTSLDCWYKADDGKWMTLSKRKGEGVPGLVGWEFHGDPADISGLRVVASGEAVNTGGETAHWTSTLYPGAKNNWVFNASTIWWAQGLSSPPGHILPYSHFGRPHGPDPRVERITRNILDRFARADGK